MPGVLKYNSLCLTYCNRYNKNNNIIIQNTLYSGCLINLVKKLVFQN